MKFTASIAAAILAHLACAEPCYTVTEYVDAATEPTPAPWTGDYSSAVEEAPAFSSSVEEAPAFTSVVEEGPAFPTTVEETPAFSSVVEEAPAASSAVESPVEAAPGVDGVEAVDRPTTTSGPIGYASLNGGTTGGEGGSTTTVSSIAEFTAAAEADGPAVIYVSGEMSGTEVIRPTSDKSIIGLSGATLDGIGFYVKEVSNVIIQNLIMRNVIDDCVGIDLATNIWVDHMDLSSNFDNGKDYYDGLVDITHAADYVTVSNTFFHDHWKASLIGHSDDNADEDTGYLHVTMHNNIWENVNSRQPSVRFGTVHIFNSIFEAGSQGGDSAVNTRMGAQVLVEGTIFSGYSDPVMSDFSDLDGYAVLRDNDYGSGSPSAPEGTLSSVPYEYSAIPVGDVQGAVVGSAGATL
ncbi:hypothetical protein MBLNU230_g3129t1 [Neophaeotheca triangularis]